MTTQPLEGKIAYISGAAGGIGSSIATLFKQSGAQILLSDLESERLRSLEQQLGSLAVATDLRFENSVANSVTTCLEHYGRIDIVVNAAGLLRTGAVDQMAVEEWDALMNVNLRGVFLTCKHTVPALKKTSGVMVNLSSVSAFVGSSIGSAYHASKGAILSLTYALAQELAPYGIRVNAICPGWVNAGFTHQALEQTTQPEALFEAARANHLLGRMAEPEEIAQAALFLASSNASFITGTHLTVDGGFMVKR